MKRIAFSFFLLLFLVFSGCALERHYFSWLPTLPKAGEKKGALLKGEEAVLSAKKVIEQGIQTYEELHTYATVVIKQERLREEPLHEPETIYMKFRKPNQMYMKWIREPNKGMELIYPVQGSKMVVEPGGVLDLITPRLYLHPTDKLATFNRRHPLNEATLGHFLYTYAKDFSHAIQQKEGEVVYEYPSFISEKPAHRVEMLLPGNPASGYYCYRSVVWFDEGTRLPLQIEFYDWEGKLFERYRFEELKINLALMDKDFDENNPDYDF